MLSQAAEQSDQDDQVDHSGNAHPIDNKKGVNENQECKQTTGPSL